eukprot:644759-Pleurochrysis_carterae.AAC.3
MGARFRAGPAGVADRTSTAYISRNRLRATHAVQNHVIIFDTGLARRVVSTDRIPPLPIRSEHSTAAFHRTSSSPLSAVAPPSQPARSLAPRLQ